MTNKFKNRNLHLQIAMGLRLTILNWCWCSLFSYILSQSSASTYNGNSCDYSHASCFTQWEDWVRGNLLIMALVFIFFYCFVTSPSAPWEMLFWCMTQNVRDFPLFSCICIYTHMNYTEPFGYLVTLGYIMQAVFMICVVSAIDPYHR